MVFPGLVLPIFFLLFFFLGKNIDPFVFVGAAFIPPIWGFWNILFINFEGKSPFIDRKLNLLLWGGLLGIILSLFVFYFSLPERFFSIEGFWRFGVYFFPPVAYSFLWRHLVGHLNELMDLF
jgi:hypothetical protein